MTYSGRAGPPLAAVPTAGSQLVVSNEIQLGFCRPAGLRLWGWSGPRGPVFNAPSTGLCTLSGGAGTPHIVRVAVDRPLPAPLDYLPPAGHVGAIATGSRVRVPFGRQQLIGMVVGQAATSNVAPAKLRPITTLLDTEPLLDAGLIELLGRAADYYHHPLAELIDAALPRRLRDGAPLEAQEEYLQLTSVGVAAVAAGEPRRAQRQRAVLTALHAAGGNLPVAELATQG